RPGGRRRRVGGRGQAPPCRRRPYLQLRPPDRPPHRLGLLAWCAASAPAATAGRWRRVPALTWRRFRGQRMAGRGRRDDGTMMARISPVLLSLPFTQRWVVRNSPARRVPSHGVDLLGQRYAIDFVGVDDRGRTACRRDWRSWLSTEPPERFFAFGRPILAPAAGVVVGVHDGEPDHVARRSQLALIPYALGQAARLRQGVAAIAGNY